MVTVPRVTTPEVSAQPDRRNQQTVNSGALLAGATNPGKQLSGLGAAASKSGSQIFDIGIEIAKRENIRESLEREASLSETLRTKLYDPNNGLLTRQGKNAIGVTKEGTETFRALDGEAQKGIKNGHQREIWARLMRQRRETTLNALARHEATQQRSATIEQMTATAALSVAEARKAAAQGVKYPDTASMKVGDAPPPATSTTLQHTRTKAEALPANETDIVAGKIYQKDGKFFEAVEDMKTGTMVLRKTSDPSANQPANTLVSPTGRTDTAINSPFGPRGPVKGVPNASRNHPGVDYNLPQGAPVHAAHDGKVTAVQGITVEVTGANGVKTRYVHVRGKLQVGSTVKAGDVIAVVGPKDAQSQGPHLHFETYKNGQRVDPKTFSYSDTTGRTTTPPATTTRADADRTVNVATPNTAAVKETVARGVDIVRSRAQLQGLSREGTELAVKKYKEAVHGSIVQDLASINPAQARTYLWQNKDVFDPLKFKQVDHSLAENAFKVELTQYAGSLFKKHPNSQTDARAALAKRADLSTAGRTFTMEALKKHYAAQTEALKVRSQEELVKAMRQVRESKDPLIADTPWLAVDESKLTEGDKKKWKSFLTDRTPETNLREYESVQKMTDEKFKEWADAHTVKGQAPLSMLAPAYLNWAPEHVKRLQDRINRLNNMGSSESPLSKFAADYLTGVGIKLDPDDKAALRFHLQEMEQNLKDQGRALSREQMIQITKDTWKAMGNSVSKLDPDTEKEGILKKSQIPDQQFEALNTLKNPATGKRYSEESHRRAWTAFKRRAVGWSPAEIESTSVGRLWRRDLEIAAMREGVLLSDMHIWNKWRERNGLGVINFYEGLETTPPGPGPFERLGDAIPDTRGPIEKRIGDTLRRILD